MYTASIVIYNTKFETLRNLIYSILDSGKIDLLYLFDNNPVDDAFLSIRDHRICYIKSKKNIGFGAGHNLAIAKAYELGSQFHFFINPDIYLKSEVISNLIDSMSLNPNIGLMMPSILNSDETIQYLPKLLPTPFSLIVRKLNNKFPFFKNYISRYELRNLPSIGIFDIPVVSGCFSVIRREAFEIIGGFDDRYFLYFEDWDLSRRISTRFRTVINTSVHVVHDYHSGANKHPKLFYFYVSSALKYFKKWGFLFDNERRRINNNALRAFSHA